VATLILRADECLAHDPGFGHPERAARLQAIHDSLDVQPVAGTTTRHPRLATRDELLAVHDEAHVRRIPAIQLDPDTATSALSHEAALVSAGASLEAAEAVLGGADGAFALVRPPGHHALRDRAMGFCLFNNVATAAEHAVRELGCKRVLVVDPDVHHGNGTQEIFWRRRDVLYVSSHRYPFYPGTGAIDETGAGAGDGFTVNLPLPEATTDADFLHAWQRVVDPVVSSFEPDLILVSAGFDTWHQDPMGGFLVTEIGFRAFFGLVKRWADTHCPGRVACTLEGGYNTSGVVAGVRAALGVLAGNVEPPEGVEGAVSREARAATEAARHRLSSRWPALRG
jgi:acetoin utilization deacetylase AcuC-like enzyme